MAGIEYPIDENGLLVLELSPPADGVVKGRIVSRYQEDSDLAANVARMSTFITVLGKVRPSLPEFEIPVSEDPHLLQWSLDGQEFADFEIRNGSISEFLWTRKLSVIETRMIGRVAQKYAKLPCYVDYNNLIMPLTDLHTHQSGQVRAHDLIELGLKHNVLYPTAALEALNIEYPKDRLSEIPRRIFLPLAHLQKDDALTEPALPLSMLSQEGLRQLELAMDLSPESQRTYEDMEYCYYYREPFTKEVALFPDILEKIARDYQKDGIIYAELSSNAIIDPKWLKAAHDVLPRIEAETGVQLRFLVGLPRNLDAEMLASRLDQIKHIAQSPYIVGIDILGYEMNKTSSLQQQLEEFLGWAKVYSPDLILRIHAGENGKNRNNVRQSLELAERYGIRLRVGHAVYGIDGATMALAKQLSDEGKLIVEFNPDSNIAGNNVDSPADIPIRYFLSQKIASTLNSDGSGIYRTNARQIAMAGQCCGIDPMGFDLIRKTELAHIARQQEIFEKERANLPPDFFDSIELKPLAKRSNAAASQHVDDEHASLKLQAMLDGRRPVLIAGANGSSWEAINSDDQQKIRAGLRQLVYALDPENAVFLMGRIKDRGVGSELLAAINQYNATHEKKFDCAMVLVESERAHIDPPLGISMVVELDAPLLNLPGAMQKLMKAYRGIGLFAGGQSFTRDFIMTFDQNHIPFGLIRVHGASGEKAEVYPGHSHRGSEAFVASIKAIDPSLLTSSARVEFNRGGRTYLGGAPMR